MIAKILTFFGILVITGLAAMFFLAEFRDTSDLEDTFVVDAVYFKEQRLVTISFEDKSRKSTSVVLEVLGMDETFQRYHESPNFTEDVVFELPPKFGWKVHPVTFVVEHPDLGQVSLKTEIHAPGDPKPPVIYGHP